MSSHILPNAPTKKHTSEREYNMHEERASQTLSASHRSENTTATMHLQDEDVQDPVRRRAKARSSSMYEEWKAQALRNDNSATTTSITIEKREQKDNERAEKQAPAQEGGTRDAKSRRQRRGSTVHRGRRHSNANRDRTPSTNRDGHSGPSDLEPRQNTGYTAPNGTYFTLARLAKLSCGIKITNGDTAYFRPSFVEDPWKDIPAIKTHCLTRF